MRYPGALRPLRHPTYRLLAGSLTASLFGTGMLIVATVWQVVALGGGAGDLGTVTATGSAGLLLTGLLGGVLADRIPQRHILVGVEACKTLAVATIAALSLTGHLQVWHLAVTAFIGGVMDSLYYPAYSALLPAILPENDLLAANGLEGMLRPVFVNGLGPALAGAIVASASPGLALATSATSTALAAAFLMPLEAGPVARRIDDVVGRHRLVAVVDDLRQGVGYMARTPWLWATLGFASLLCFLVIGPIEVLIPFAVKDQAGGGPAQHALVLALFGAGGALGSLVVASRRLPRRYLTWMLLGWGVGSAPLVLVGFTHSVGVMGVATFVVGACGSGAQVIWGTLLQRRVPPELLGRVSSLDFFVSLMFTPVSMAVAVPVATTIGLAWTFAIAGLVPGVLAVVAIVMAGLWADEIAHPLDGPAVVADSARPARE